MMNLALKNDEFGIKMMNSAGAGVLGEPAPVRSK